MMSLPQQLKQRMWRVLATATLVTLTTSAQAQMVMPGSFAVSPSGAATYTIPIQVPPGAGGVEPKLALVYNSQAGNGLLGAGWALSGLSSITRCAPSPAQDGTAHHGAVTFTSADRFCLDGERLQVVSGEYGSDGASYRSELEKYSKIVSTDISGISFASSPGRFLIQTKEGWVYEYGGTSDSRVMATGVNSNVVGGWNLNRIIDQKGNFLVIKYNTPDPAAGESYPLWVTYGGAGGSQQGVNSIYFEYDFNRPDKSTTYQAGSYIASAARLTRISTAYGVDARSGAGVSLASGLFYSFTYEATGTLTPWTRLSEIKQCRTGGSCLPMLKFDGAIESATIINSKNGSWPSWGERYYLGDFDGDGIDDLFLVADPSKGVKYDGWSLYRGTSSGFVLLTNGKWPSHGERYFVGDFNGDGKSDLMFTADPSCKCWEGWKIWLSTGAGFVESGSGTWPSHGENFTAGDFNGDGRTDFFVTADQAYKSFDGWKVYVSNGATLQYAFGGSWPSWGDRLYVADFDGDGMSDVFAVSDDGCKCWDGWKLLINTGGAFSMVATGAWPSWGEKYILGDYNGDGKTDLFVIPSQAETGWDGWKLYAGTGKGFAEKNAGSWPSWGERYQPADFNGDGKTDLLISPSEKSRAWPGWRVYLSAGDGFKDSNYASWPSWGEDFLVMESNGDGKSDILVRGGSSRWDGWKIYESDGTPFARITSVSDGVSSLSWNLSSLPRLQGASSYIREDSRFSLPYSVRAPAMFVATQSTSSNGVGGVRTRRHAYGNFVTEIGLQARSASSFEWTQVKDVSTGLVSRTYYRQDFPFIGQVDKVGRGTSEADWYNLGLTTYKYTFKAFGPTDADYASPVTCVDDPSTGRPLKSCTDSAIKPGNRYVPYTHEVLDKNSDWSADQTNAFIALPQTRTTTTQDNWGNATQIKVETLKPDGSASGHSKTTSTVFAEPDKVNWRLGRVIKSAVTSTAP